MPLITYLGLIAELIAVIAGTCFFSKIKHRFLYLYLFTCMALLSELSMHAIFWMGGRNNLIISHIYSPLEFLFLALLYIHQQVLKKKWAVPLVLFFMLYCAINPFFIQSFNEYSQVRSFSSIIFVLFSIIYYHKTMLEAKIKKLSAEPMVWVNTAVLLYFSGSLFFNALFSLVLEYSVEFSKLTTYYFGVLSIVFYLLIAVGFLKAGKEKNYD